VKHNIDPATKNALDARVHIYIDRYIYIYSAEREIEGEEKEKPVTEAPIRKTPGIKFANRKESSCRTRSPSILFRAVLELRELRDF